MVAQWLDDTLYLAFTSLRHATGIVRVVVIAKGSALSARWIFIGSPAMVFSFPLLSNTSRNSSSSCFRMRERFWPVGDGFAAWVAPCGGLSGGKLVGSATFWRVIEHTGVG